MLEILLIVVLLVVFAPLWIALIYVAGVLLLYILVFVVAWALTAFVIAVAGGTPGEAAIIGLIAALFAAKGLALIRAENSS